MHCNSSACMPKWFTSSCHGKKEFFKGEFLFSCHLSEITKPQSSPLLFSLLSERDAEKENVATAIFLFASHYGNLCLRSVDDRQVSQSGKPHLHRNSGCAVSKLARECYSLWTYGKSFTLCTLEHADRMNGIPERPPEVLPFHPSYLLGTLSLHPTKDLRGLLDYWRTQI